MNQETADHEPSTSVSLLERARQGDQDGWRRLAQIYGPIVYGWARRCGFQPADAADVMQETFASVSKAIGGFDHDRPGATFRGWLWTIARNKLRDHVRADQAVACGGTDAQIRLNQIAGPVAANGPEEPPSAWDASDPPSRAETDAASVQRRAVELIRENFDPRTWTMFWESAVVGRAPGDIAEEMGVSKWAVYKARARVLQRLQQETRELS